MTTTAGAVGADPAADLDAYRRGLRAHLAAPSLDRWRGRFHPTTEARIHDHGALLAALHGAGWNRYGWPESAGGLGGDVLHRAVLYDELSRAGLPVPDPCLMLETLAPALLRFAPDLADAYLPRYLRGEEWWGQGFSEPEAGSDLAALRCRAHWDGESYIVSGQKLWTTHGATASRLVCLVRTGTPESRHRGLSMIMIDVDSPGVAIRPIAIASGLNELAEVFFDDVAVPASRLIGAENDGWAVAMHLMQFERSMYAWQSAAVALRRIRELRDQAATLDKLPDGAVRRLGETYADVVSLRARSADTLRRLAAGQSVGPEASVDKVLLARVEIGLFDLARDVFGPAFLLSSSDEMREWRADWWFSRSATILGGSAEVQRTILADQVLGLPREQSA
ncbi:acyl-CoA dehydrogenase family protein [Tomitella biformata]|uniref:acyl-CoA dehydrogenase family protein n=1 Tax=Tomitella biformata TaxID=630403 RepID=UPI000467CD85|nr:acyl-CoA dehydrogenase family protein [Tomitella biformata]